MWLFDYFRKKREEHNANKKNRNLNKPSLSRKDQDVILKLVKLFEDKQYQFIRDYQWLDIEWADDFQQGSILLHDTHRNTTKSFTGTKIGQFENKSGTWNWAWIDNGGALQRDSGIMKVRNYGFYNYMELLTKSRWTASSKDITDMCAISMAILSGIGVIELETKEGVDYILIMDFLKG